MLSRVFTAGMTADLRRNEIIAAFGRTNSTPLQLDWVVLRDNTLNDPTLQDGSARWVVQWAPQITIASFETTDQLPAGYNVGNGFSTE